MITVRVPLADKPYDVIVGAGARERLPDVLPPQAKRVAVVTGKLPARQLAPSGLYKIVLPAPTSQP